MQDTHQRLRRESPSPFSSIRTVTVGFGLSPNLLTPIPMASGARGLHRLNLHHRR